MYLAAARRVTSRPPDEKGYLAAAKRVIWQRQKSYLAAARRVTSVSQKYLRDSSYNTNFFQYGLFLSKCIFVWKFFLI